METETVCYWLTCTLQLRKELIFWTTYQYVSD